MLSINMINDFQEQINKTYEALLDMVKVSGNDNIEIEEMRSLYYVIEDAKYLMLAISTDFDVEKDNPGTCYLFDKKRNMFWKERGYTRYINHAKLFDTKDAKIQSASDYNNNTKIVYFEF